MDVLFFPNDENVDKLVKYLELAKSTLDICVFTITNNKLSNAIFYLYKIAGVKVRIISDDMQSETKGSDCHELADTGIPVRLDADPKAHMHNKFAIIDNRILVNGSFNWTVQAVTSNQENVVILDSPELCETFTGEFNKLWDNFKANQLKNENETAYRFRKIEEKFSGDQHNPKIRKNRSKKKTKELFHLDYNPYQDDDREYGDGWF